MRLTFASSSETAIPLGLPGCIMKSSVYSWLIASNPLTDESEPWGSG